MKSNQIICAITLISMLTSIPMAGINRDKLATKARSVFETAKEKAGILKTEAAIAKEKATVIGRAAWQKMSTSTLAKKASSMLKTLQKDMICIYRWDCTPEQRKRILKEVSALMALVGLLLTAKIVLDRKRLAQEREQWKQHLEAEKPTDTTLIETGKELQEEQQKLYEQQRKLNEEAEKIRKAGELRQLREEMEEITRRRQEKKQRK